MPKHAVTGPPRPSPPIVSTSVTLRCLTVDDAPKIFAMSQEAEMRVWLPDQVYESEAHALQVLRCLIASYDDPGTPSLAPFVLGVDLNDSRELIGHVGLSPLRGEVEIGFAIEARHQSKGLATEAVRAMSEWALRRFELQRILGVVARDNAGSSRVLQRAGFTFTVESPRGWTYERVR
jgi:ribosomal-protein-alanine N-acetyltransferase